MTFWRTPGQEHSCRTAASTACMRSDAYSDVHLQKRLQPLTCSRLWQTCQAVHVSQDAECNQTWWVN